MAVLNQMVACLLSTHECRKMCSHLHACYLFHILQDDVFQNTFGFGRDSNKAAKELGDFGSTMFNISAGEAAEAMEVCWMFFWGWGGGRCKRGGSKVGQVRGGE